MKKALPAPSNATILVMLLGCGLILGLGIYVGIGLFSKETIEIQLSQSKSSLSNESSSSMASLTKGSAETVSNSSMSQVSESTIALTTTSQKSYVLNLYPEQIRRSIIDGFEGAQKQPAIRSPSSLRSPRLSQDKNELNKSGQLASGNNDASDLLNVLERTSEVTLPDPAPETQTEYEDAGEMSAEQRREVIRQRFLEAIQRAAQNAEN